MELGRQVWGGVPWRKGSPAEKDPRGRSAEQASGRGRVVLQLRSAQGQARSDSGSIAALTTAWQASSRCCCAIQPVHKTQEGHACSRVGGATRPVEVGSRVTCQAALGEARAVSAHSIGLYSPSRVSVCSKSLPAVRPQATPIASSNRRAPIALNRRAKRMVAFDWICNRRLVGETGLVRVGCTLAGTARKHAPQGLRPNNACLLPVKRVTWLTIAAESMFGGVRRWGAAARTLRPLWGRDRPRRNRWSWTFHGCHTLAALQDDCQILAPAEHTR